VKKLEQRSEDRKLAKWTHGRWGGVVFVPGGLLVQGDKFKNGEDGENRPDSSAEEQEESPDSKAAIKSAKVLRKAERQARKEAKLLKRAESIPDSACHAQNKMNESTHETAEDMQTVDSQEMSIYQTDNVKIENHVGTNPKPKKRKTVKSKHRSHSEQTTATTKRLDEAKAMIDPLQLPTPPSDSAQMPVSAQTVPSDLRNGRHALRGREIQAKRMAFADATMLDQVRQSVSDPATVALMNDRSS
jgi:hypothetical protein